MKTKIFSLFIFFTLVTITFSQAQENSLTKDVKALLDQYGEAVGSKSTAKMADCFHDDAMILPQDKPVVNGREAIVESFKWLETVDFTEKFVIEEIIPAGEYSLVRTRNLGSWKDPKTGDSGSFEVKALLFVKPNANGELKIYRYMFNGNGE